MEKISKEDLKKRSKEIFRLNAKANELHATEDGNFFEKKGDARNHNLKVVKGDVHSFYRDGIVPADVSTPLDKTDGGPTKEKPKANASTGSATNTKKAAASAGSATNTKKAVAPAAKKVTKPVVKKVDTKDGGKE